MFQEHLADITIYNGKSPVQSTTVGFSGQAEADLNWFHSLQVTHVLFLANTRSPLRVRC